MKGQWGKLVGWFVGTLAVSAAVTFGLPMIGGGSWLPDQISRESGAIDNLFWALLWVSVVIFAMVATLVIYCITHFRAEPGDMSDGEHIHGNAKLEVAWIIIPTIIVAVISAVSYMVLEDNEIGLFDKARAHDKGAAQIQVDVRGFSFAWNFRYADENDKSAMPADSQPASELVLPIHKVVRFNVMSCSGTEHVGRVIEEKIRELHAHGRENEFAKIEPSLCEQKWDTSTDADLKDAEKTAEDTYVAKERKQGGKHLSKEQQALLDAEPVFHGDNQYLDVNHAFWVPEARLKVDAISGLRTYVQWQATKVTGPEDRYQVVCAELCGTGHNGMRTNMCIVEQSTYDWWVGLSDDDRRAASCVNLRLLTCLDGQSDLDATIGKLDALTKKRPDAGCKQVKEAVA